MKISNNIWGISEFTGDGLRCPVMPVKLPLYKKIFLLFFRFGICPLCMTMSLSYYVAKYLKRFSKAPKAAVK